MRLRNLHRPDLSDRHFDIDHVEVPEGEEEVFIEVGDIELHHHRPLGMTNEELPLLGSAPEFPHRLRDGCAGE